MRLSGHVRDGIIALAPASAALIIGALVGMLAAPLALPLWFFGRCVFTDDVAYRILNPEAPVGTCAPVPSLTWWHWALGLGLLASLGMIGCLVHRYSVRRRLEWERFHVRLWPTDLFAAPAGLLLTYIWAQYVPVNWLWTFDFPGFVRFVSPVAAILWWRVISLAATSVYAHTAPEDPVIASTVHMLLARQFRVRRLMDLDVQCDGESLTITGPFDVVDAGRVQDVLKSEYPITFAVDLQSTLPEDVYWRPHREELTSTGYRSKPLQETRVPAVLVYGIVLTGVVLIGVAMLRGPGLVLRADDLSTVVEATTRREAWYEEWLARKGIQPDEHEPFAIDIEGSLAACPHFAVDETTARYRLPTELRVVRKANEPAVRIHRVADQYYLFFIDRSSRTCVKEFVFLNMQAARSGAGQYSGRANWEPISSSNDWRHVPPIPF